jgi:hypothetical protein
MCLVSAILTVLLAGTFAFVKVNGRPFHLFLLNMIQTLRKPSLRVWNHRAANAAQKEETEIKYENVGVNKQLDEARLAELSLIIDTKGKYQGEGNPGSPDSAPTAPKK